VRIPAVTGGGCSRSAAASGPCVRKEVSAEPARPGSLIKVADHSAHRLQLLIYGFALNPGGAQPQTGVVDYAQGCAKRRSWCRPSPPTAIFLAPPIPRSERELAQQAGSGGELHRRPG